MLLLWVYAEPLTHPYNPFGGYQDELKPEEILWIWEANRDN